MNFEQIIKLQEAGFSNDEIRKMAAAIAAEPAEKPAEAPKEAAPINNTTAAEKPAETAAEGAKEDVKPDAIDALNNKIESLAAALEKMAKMPLFPSMDDVKPLGVDDVIVKFFKE